MKALSIKQPWAGLIRLGLKTVEVRSWSTRYRGPLLVCAGASPMRGFRCPPGEAYQLGHALCVVNLVGVAPFDRALHGGSCCIPEDRLHEVAGQFAWILRGVREFEPFPIKGQLGLFEVQLSRLRPALMSP